MHRRARGDRTLRRLAAQPHELQAVPPEERAAQLQQLRAPTSGRLRGSLARRRRRRPRGGGWARALNYGPGPRVPWKGLFALKFRREQEHVWFWEPNLKVRTLAMMIPIYHDVVGRGMVMELAFSIDRTGRVDPTHQALYQAFCAWIKKCYGSPVAEITPSAEGLRLRHASSSSSVEEEQRKSITPLFRGC